MPVEPMLHGHDLQETPDIAIKDEEVPDAEENLKVDGKLKLDETFHFARKIQDQNYSILQKAIDRRTIGINSMQL